MTEKFNRVVLLHDAHKHGATTRGARIRPNATKPREDAAPLQRGALSACDGPHQVRPISSTEVVTFVLLGAQGRTLTLTEMCTLTEPLLDYLTTREIPRADESLNTKLGLRVVLDQLVDAGSVTVYSAGPEPIWSIPKGCDTVTALHRNDVLHHMVTRAIVELAVLHASEHGGSLDPIASVWREARRLRDLLKFEFFFASTREFRSAVFRELELVDPTECLNELDEQSSGEVLLRARLLVAPRCLRAFLNAQLVVAQVLAESPTAVTNESRFLSQCLKEGGHLLPLGARGRHDSGSMELYTNGYALARDRGLLDGPEEPRMDYLAQIRDLVARLDRLAELEGHLEGLDVTAAV